SLRIPRENATSPAAAPASRVRHRAATLHLCSCSEDPAGTSRGPAGIAPGSVAPASTATHSLPDLPPATDLDNSSTPPDRPTTDGPSRAPEPGCRARASPGPDADPPAPADSETRSSTGTPAPAIPGSISPASGSAPANYRDMAQTTARNWQWPSPPCRPPPAHRAPATAEGEPPRSVLP